jgi:hypothetical protein
MNTKQHYVSQVLLRRFAPHNKGDTFDNEWQAYRTRQEPKLDLETKHTYDAPGEYTVVVKAIDILCNDTTSTVNVKVK